MIDAGPSRLGILLEVGRSTCKQTFAWMTEAPEALRDDAVGRYVEVRDPTGEVVRSNNSDVEVIACNASHITIAGHYGDMANIRPNDVVMPVGLWYMSDLRRDIDEWKRSGKRRAVVIPGRIRGDCMTFEEWKRAMRYVMRLAKGTWPL